MPYVVQAYFDAHTEAAIRAINKRLADDDVAPYVFRAGHRPHISLAIYEEIDVAACRQQLAALAQTTPPIPVTLSHFGIFVEPKSVVFAAPTVTSPLLQLHHQAFQALESLGREPRPYYLPEHWVPHCTIAFFDEVSARIPEAVAIVQTLSLPLEAQLQEIGLIQARPVEDLFTLPLEI
jgi:2'-5' RNA ligase